MSVWIQNLLTAQWCLYPQAQRRLHSWGQLCYGLIWRLGRGGVGIQLTWDIFGKTKIIMNCWTGEFHSGLTVVWWPPSALSHMSLFVGRLTERKPNSTRVSKWERMSKTAAKVFLHPNLANDCITYASVFSWVLHCPLFKNARKMLMHYFYPTV